MKRLRALPDALSEHVLPGMSLCFASTPSRSNAAVRELARLFRGTNPEFTLLATGFHSQLHLLARLRLARRYVGCFFGDNYPTPRANALYSQLIREGYELEQWSLWSYCSALAAGAFGHPYALTRSLSGTSLGEALKARGILLEVPDPDDDARPLSMVRALRPDITFLHAPVGDALGNVAFAAPYGEGLYGALAARLGAIVTVERIVPSEVLAGMPHWVALPAHRVLAVCEEPYGAHPQPLHVAPPELRALTPGYADDYGAYQSFCSMSQDSAAFDEFSRRVLDAKDGRTAYVEFYGADVGAVPAPASPAPVLSATALEPHDHLLLLAARTLARRIAAAGHDSILAGIGQAFAACRLAKQMLGDAGKDVELMVETGFAGIDVERAHPFLLSRENVATARRLGSIEQMLGALCCGNAGSCMGVIGAAEVDAHGNVNSSFSDGELLVGPGGAPDIAACAQEVMVLTRADPRRLRQKVQYVTSRGDNVRCIVTEACVFERSAVGEPWQARDLVPTRASVLKSLQQSGFRFVITGPPSEAPPPTEQELNWLARLRVVSEGRKAGSK